MASGNRADGRTWPLRAGSAAKASALMVTTLLFFLIYRAVPDAPVGTRVAVKVVLWPGGVLRNRRLLPTREAVRVALSDGGVAWHMQMDVP